MDKFTPLPQAYKDEIQLDEALTDPEIKRRIEAIDLFILLARDIRKNGKVDVADALCQGAEKVFDEFRKKQPLFDNLQRQRDAYDEDQKKWATLTEDLTRLDNKIAQYKQKISELLKERKKTSKEIEGLDVKFGLMHPHTQYREAMVEDAEKNEAYYAERSAIWAMEVETKIAEGDIRVDEDGVSIHAIDLKIASKKVQEAMIKKHFAGRLFKSLGRNDHQGNTSKTPTVKRKDIDTHGDEFDNGWALCTYNELTQITDWIRNTFTGVQTYEEELYFTDDQPRFIGITVYVMYCSINLPRFSQYVNKSER